MMAVEGCVMSETRKVIKMSEVSKAIEMSEMSITRAVIQTSGKSYTTEMKETGNKGDE